LLTFTLIDGRGFIRDIKIKSKKQLYTLFMNVPFYIPNEIV